MNQNTRNQVLDRGLRFPEVAGPVKPDKLPSPWAKVERWRPWWLLIWGVITSLAAVAMAFCHVVGSSRCTIDWLTLAFLLVPLAVGLIPDITRLKLGQLEAEMRPAKREARTVTDCGFVPVEKVVTVSEGDPVRQASRIMVSNDFSQLPVLDSSRIFVGLITEKDIVAHLLGGGSADTQVGDLAAIYQNGLDTPNLRPYDDIGQAERKLAEQKVQLILVTTDNGLVQGILTRADIVRGLAQ